MHKRLYSFLEKYDILHSLQFGFRTKHSTLHALISLMESVKQTVDEGILGCGVFIDLQKAFDTVNHFNSTTEITTLWCERYCSKLVLILLN